MTGRNVSTGAGEGNVPAKVTSGPFVTSVRLICSNRTRTLLPPRIVVAEMGLKILVAGLMNSTAWNRATSPLAMILLGWYGGSPMNWTGEMLIRSQ